MKFRPCRQKIQSLTTPCHLFGLYTLHRVTASKLDPLFDLCLDHSQGVCFFSLTRSVLPRPVPFYFQHEVGLLPYIHFHPHWVGGEPPVNFPHLYTKGSLYLYMLRWFPFLMQLAAVFTQLLHLFLPSLGQAYKLTFLPCLALTGGSTPIWSPS